MDKILPGKQQRDFGVEDLELWMLSITIWGSCREHTDGPNPQRQSFGLHLKTFSLCPRRQPQAHSLIAKGLPAAPQSSKLIQFSVQPWGNQGKWPKHLTSLHIVPISNTVWITSVNLSHNFLGRFQFSVPLDNKYVVQLMALIKVSLQMCTPCVKSPTLH